MKHTRPYVLSLVLLELATSVGATALPTYVLLVLGPGLETGLTLGIGLLPRIVLGSAAGALIDRTNPAYVAMGGSLVGAITAALIAQVDSVTGLQVVLVLAGTAGVVASPARLAIRNYLATEETRTTLNSAIVVSERVGQTGGPLLAAGAISLWSVPSAFTVQATLLILATISLLPLVGWLTTAKQREKADAESSSDPVPNWRTLTRDRPLVALTITGIAYVAGLGASRLYLAWLAVESFPDVESAFGIILACIAFGGVVGAALAPRLIKMAGDSNAYISANLFEAAAWLVVAALASSLPMIGFLCVMIGIAESIATVVYFSAVHERVPASITGRYFSIALPWMDVGLFAGTAVGGVLVAQQYARWGGAVVAAGLIGLPVLLTIRQLSRLFDRRPVIQPAAEAVEHD